MGQMSVNKGGRRMARGTKHPAFRAKRFSASQVVQGKDKTLGREGEESWV
jgi:hypothetical protein